MAACNPAISVSLPQSETKQPRLLAGKLLHSLGVNLLVLAVLATAYISSPILYKELKYRFGPKPAEVSVKANFSQIINDEEITRQKLVAEEAQKYGVPTDFSIVIPKIDAKAKIVPNVHPGDKEEYLEALKQGVAHAYGTSFPGSKGNIFLFSHSTNADYNIERFNAIFYLLKDLEAEDKIIIFYAGQKFTYLVIHKQITEANDTSWLTSGQLNPSGEQLILQTCWPPGTSLKRLVVIAKPI